MPVNVPDPYKEALTLLDAGKRVKAEDLLRWVGRDRDPLAYDEVRAEMELEDNRFGAAAGLAERTLRAGRETPRLRMIAADAQWYLGRGEEARAHADLVTSDSARAAFLKGRIAFDNGELELAESLGERAVESHPDWVAPRALALAARAARGERDGHIALRLLWERTRDRWALTLLMKNLVKRPDDRLGEDLLREAAEAGMVDADFLSQVLWYRNSQRQWDQAIEAYDHAPEAAQNTAWNLAARGRAAFGKGDYADAIPYLERARALNPLDEWTVDFLFNALMHRGKWWRAIRVSGEHSNARTRLGADDTSLTSFYRNLRWRSRRKR